MYFKTNRFKKISEILFCLIVFNHPVYGHIIRNPTPLIKGFAPIPYAGRHNISTFQVSSKSERVKRIHHLCTRLQKEYKRYGWRDVPCATVNWQFRYTSRAGYPLIYAVFGDGPNTTLFMGGVHPDERTPIHLVFRLARHLQANPSMYKNSGYRIVVAPLVNPDGFFLKKPLRTNGMVDVNRNFPTRDWHDRALQKWSSRRKGASRYFPGYFPNTEIETIFQTEIMDHFKPHKIFSIHAPYGFLDYDGPGDQKILSLSGAERKARRFVHKIAEKSANYRVVDYSFYPGSLGNFAGNERSIPTVTLELENTAPRMVNNFWQRFLPAFVQSIQYHFKKAPDDKHRTRSL